MAENTKVVGKAAGQSSSSEPEGIRITDRRRFNLDHEEITSEGDASTGSERSLKPTYVEELEQRTLAAERKLLEVKARFDQLSAQLQREADETRQRLNRAADERARGDKANFISALLPVLDNLLRAVSAAEQGGSFDSVIEGVRGTSVNFENALSAAGVETIDAVDAPFNPELHDAVDTFDVEPSRDGIVTAEYSRGYKIGDRLLRPARVQVGRSAVNAKRAAE